MMQPLSTVLQSPTESFGQPGRVLRAGLILVGVAAVIFVVSILVGVLVIGRRGGGPIQAWDDTVGRWYLHHRGGLVGISKVVATYLDALPLGIICVGLTAVLALTLRTSRALIPIVAYLGGEFQVFAIRAVIHRHRPPTANYPAAGALSGVDETSYSFPSGHSVAVYRRAVRTVGVHRTDLSHLVVAHCYCRFTLCDRHPARARRPLVQRCDLRSPDGMCVGLAVAVVARQVEWDDFLAMVRPITSFQSQ